MILCCMHLLPIEPFAFNGCVVIVPLALWNDAELELAPNKIIWLLEAVVMLLQWPAVPLPLLALGWWSLSMLRWITVCTDVLLDTDDCCWNICWCEWCKLFARDLVRFNGTSAMSFSSREEARKKQHNQMSENDRKIITKKHRKKTFWKEKLIERITWNARLKFIG